jgi:hypothetical protein
MGDTSAVRRDGRILPPFVACFATFRGKNCQLFCQPTCEEEDEEFRLPRPARHSHPQLLRAALIRPAFCRRAISLVGATRRGECCSSCAASLPAFSSAAHFAAAHDPTAFSPRPVAPQRSGRHSAVCSNCGGPPGILLRRALPRGASIPRSVQPSREVADAKVDNWRLPVQCPPRPRLSSGCRGSTPAGFFLSYWVKTAMLGQVSG